MIFLTDSVGGVEPVTSWLHLSERVLRRFGLFKSIEVSTKFQIGRTPPAVGALTNRCLEEKLVWGLKTRHVSPLVKPYGVDSYRRITGAFLGYLNGRLGEISLMSIHQKMANCARKKN